MAHNCNQKNSSVEGFCYNLKCKFYSSDNCDEPFEVETHPTVGGFVDILDNFVEFLHFHHQIARFRLGVVVHQVRNDLLDQFVEVGFRLFVLARCLLPLSRNLAR